jgi:hypothetical protein
MPRLAGPTGLILAGASLLLFALTADVWRTSEPFRLSALTRQQALPPAETTSAARAAPRPRARHHRSNAPSQRVVVASREAPPSGRGVRSRGEGTAVVRAPVPEQKAAARLRRSGPARDEPATVPGTPPPPSASDTPPSPPEPAPPAPPEPAAPPPPAVSAAPPPSPPPAAPLPAAARVPAAGAPAAAPALDPAATARPSEQPVAEEPASECDDSAERDDDRGAIRRHESRDDDQDEDDDEPRERWDDEDDEDERDD